MYTNTMVQYRSLLSMDQGPILRTNGPILRTNGPILRTNGPIFTNIYIGPLLPIFYIYNIKDHNPDQ